MQWGPCSGGGAGSDHSSTREIEEIFQTIREGSTSRPFGAERSAQSASSVWGMRARAPGGLASG